MYNKNETLLSISNVNFSFLQESLFRKPIEKKILRDINLTIKNITRESVTGQVVTLLGRSGVGKTQLFNIISGLTKPTSGEVKIGIEQKIVVPGIVGTVLQTYPLFSHRTLFSNLSLKSKDNSLIDFYLNEFDLIDCKFNYPAQLSGGQRQRAAIVQQLLCSEHFILLDEPFSGLDPVSTEKLCKTINKIVNLHDHNSVIISSHILEPSLAISDTCWILGHQYSYEQGQKTKVPGATILKIEDFAEQGLSWNPEIRKMPAFINKCEEIRQFFFNNT